MTFPFIVVDDLMKDEGFRGQPYKDSVGKLTVGFGRNLDDNPLTMTEAKSLLYSDITRTVGELDRLMPWWRQLDETRQAVMVNMAFNLGTFKLLGFAKMLKSARSHDYATAAAEMLDSKWAKQVGHRAQRLAQEMRTGVRA